MVLAYMPSIVFATDADNNTTVDPNSQNEEVQNEKVQSKETQNKEQTQTLDQAETSDDTNQFQIMADDDEEDVDPGAESDYDDEIEDNGYEEEDDADEQEEDNSEYDDPDLVPDPATVKDNPPELPDKKGDAKLQKKYTKNGGDGNYTRLIKAEDFDPYGICCWDNKTSPPEGCKAQK